MQLLALSRSRMLIVLGGCIVAATIGVVYYSALTIGFWSDDYAFLETAARLSFRDYIIWYFDPRMQALWYRPIPGLLWWIEWHIFGGNAAPYHVVYIAIHIANCLLLYALIARATHQWPLGFASAIAYSGFDVYSLAVMRPSDETPLAAFFYLLTIWFWLRFLTKNRWPHYALAYFSFVFALFSKEASVTLPAILLLVDRLLIGDKTTIKSTIYRYLPFAVALIPYLIFEFTWLANSQYKTNLGYGLGLHIFPILIEYLTRISIPWGADSALAVWWLALALLVSAVAIIRQKNHRWLFVVLGILVTLAPYLPFQFVFTRFLYLPMMFSGVAIGALFAWLDEWLAGRRWLVGLMAMALAAIVTGNGLRTMDQADWLNRFAREERVPLRTISQSHPNLPTDTLLYFIDPSVPLYSGMFFLRYGAQISTGGDIAIYDTIWRSVAPQPAHLRDHDVAYVYFFDDNGQMHEQPVSKEDNTRVTPSLPADFDGGIRLDGYEFASPALKRNEAILVLLYWQATGKMNRDYTVFAHLINQDGAMVAGVDNQPRNGKMPTHLWQSSSRVIDWIIMPISKDVAIGPNYRLEFGFYDQASMQRLELIDPSGKVYSDHFSIEPISIID
jgi:dolichyl-phosphate-mannose-protein mannosyltransferase